jgi:signal transduction histidine kinase
LALQTTGANVFTDIERGLQLTSILAVTGVAVVIATGGLAAYSISQRVRQLRTDASGIAGGNLELKIKTTGDDEISALASSFEQMRGNLVRAQQELGSKNLKLQEIDQLKDEFISIASHELRTPIHPILGYALKAREGKISMQTAIDVICTQAERLKRLTNDILDVSRIESGTMSYNMQKVGIHQVLQNCLVASTSTINSKEVEISTKLDEENKNIEIVADKDRLTQVFSNIISNALKFTKKGSINIETHVDKSTEKMEINISDTGGGIPKEILPRLFGKFATKSLPIDGTNGTGLGLFISRAIVNAHGGEIEGYNNNIGGATFKIELPVNGRKR